MKLDKRSNKICLGSFDFIKGAAICIVMIGHIALDFDLSRLNWFYPMFSLLWYIKTAIMPLFFIISGYLFVPTSRRITLQKMVRMFLLPYLMVTWVFGLIQTASTYIQTRSVGLALDRYVSVTLAFLLGIPIPGKVLFGYKLYHCAIVWFLLALFWAYNILNMILRAKRIRTQIALVLGCATLGYFLFLVDFTYFCIPHGLIAVGCFYAGYLLKKSNLLEKGLPKKWMYYVWVLVAVLYSIWGEYDLCYGKFRFFPIDYIGAIFLALLLLVIGIEIGRHDWKIVDIVSSVGIYSYWVLCIHSIEQKCLPWKNLIQVTERWPNHGFILTLLIKAVIIATFCKLIKKMNRLIYRKQKKAYVQRKLCSETD